MEKGGWEEEPTESNPAKRDGRMELICLGTALCCWSLLHSAIFRSWADLLRSQASEFWENLHLTPAWFSLQLWTTKIIIILELYDDFTLANFSKKTADTLGRYKRMFSVRLSLPLQVPMLQCHCLDGLTIKRYRYKARAWTCVKQSKNSNK